MAKPRWVAKGDYGLKRKSRFGPPTRRQFLWMTAAGVTTLASLRARHQDAPAAGPPVTCAVVGVGLRGREILTMLSRQELADNKAYCDVYEPFLRRGAQLAPQSKAYRSHAEMLRESPEIEAVIVATPTHEHREIVESAFAAGKHVYCEAPMASTTEDCKAIAEAAKKASTVFAVGLQNRANPVFEHSSKFLRARATGVPVTDEGHWFENSSWRRAVSDPTFDEAINWKLSSKYSLGLAGELGVHTFDNSLRFHQDLPKAVTAFGSIMKWRDGRDVADTVFCIVEYPNGLHSRFEATLANSFRERYYLFNGTQGSILIEDTQSWLFKEADAPNLGWEVYASTERIGNEEGIVLLADATKLLEQGLMPAEHRHEPDLEDDPLYMALEDFFTSIRRNSEPACSYKEGYQSAILAIQADRALRQGERIEMDPSIFEI